MINFQVEVGELFGSQYPCTSGGGKGRSRKTNDHWTEGEMIDLVNGVSRKGIGRWSKIKGDYFSTSIRTAVHLKVCGSIIYVLCHENEMIRYGFR